MSDDSFGVSTKEAAESLRRAVMSKKELRVRKVAEEIANDERYATQYEGRIYEIEEELMELYEKDQRGFLRLEFLYGIKP